MIRGTGTNSVQTERLSRAEAGELNRPELQRASLDEFGRPGEPPSLEYWKAQFNAAPALLELPADHARAAQPASEYHQHNFSVPAAMSEAARELARTEGTGAFAVFLSAFTTLLLRYTGRTDLVLGTRIPAGEPDANGSSGILLPLRADVSGTPAFRHIVSQMQTLLQEARLHVDALLPNGPEAQSSLPRSFVDALQITPDPSYAPLFQVMFLMDAEPPAQHLDLVLRLTAGSTGELSGLVEYNPALFERSRIERLAEHFVTLLQSAVHEPGVRVSQLRLLPELEEQQVLIEFNRTEKPFRRDKTLAQLFAEQAQQSPNAEALVAGETRLTYGEVKARAWSVAARLQALGVQRESLVPICLERNWEMIAAMLGTLQAGAAYVPLDPAYPKERLGFVVRDASAPVLITQRKLLPLLPETEARILCIEDIDWLASPSDASLSVTPASTSDLAYVIYTSGSTGVPKGVAIEHRNAVALIDWARDVFTPEALSGMLASTSICFDLSVFEIFLPLSCGGRLILAENALALPTLPAAREVRLINTVPSAIRELLRLRAIPDSVQVINLAGEPLATAVVDQIYKETKTEKVYDLYGPSETTTYSTFTLRRAGEPASIGKPLANELVLLLDANRQLVPIGMPGEIYIGGVGVAREYLNRPELTAERFLPNPLKPGERVYKTGDLARWREDGNLEFLGRIDHQVKIRGFRIELGEIEIVLKKHPAVRDVVLLAREDQPGVKRLVAYVVAAHAETSPMEKPAHNNNGSSVSADDLRRHIKQFLPEYMVPALFVFLPALPLTPNGKVDRKALPAPEPERAQGDFAPPRNPTEEKLCAIWSEVLGMKQIGVRDDFFTIGGDSLLALRVVSRTREAFQVELPLFALFEASTVEAIAERLSSGRWSAPAHESPLVPLPREQPLPVSFVQERLWFLDQLLPGSHAYNVPAAFRLTGELKAEALIAAVNRLVQRHEALRTVFGYQDGLLTQEIIPVLRIALERTDLRQSGPRDGMADARARTLANETAQRPFDLARGPLFRARLLKLDEQDHILVLVLHHAVSDGWSLGILFKELRLLYEAAVSGQADPPLSPLPIQYADYAAWKRQSTRLEPELEFWKHALAGAPARLALPTDHPESDKPALKAARLTRDLPLFHKAQQLTRPEGITPFMFLMTALSVALHRWTNQSDMVIGTVVAGRNRPELENVIGCFMNFLPIRIKLTGDEIGKELLHRIRTTATEAQNHQECPFEKMVEAINPQRRLNQNPLYNVALLYQNFPADLFALRGLQTCSFPVELEAALLDLRFEVEQTGDKFAVACEYRTDLFQSATIEHLLTAFHDAAAALIEQPTLAVNKFPLPSISQPKTEETATGPKKTLAITATFTAEPLAEPLRYWLRELELDSKIEFAPYNQIFQQLLTPSSLLGCNEAGLNIVLLRLEDWQQTTGNGVSGAIERNLREFVAALRSASARVQVPHLVCVCPPSPALVAEHSASFAQLEQKLSRELEPLSGVHILNSSELARLYPVENYYDPAANELGHVPYTPLFFSALATAIARKLHALDRPPYKVIALDCDNTLWSGVCGEDGPQGVRLDAPFTGLQKFMHAQQEAGMLLCACSKNNEEDVFEVFRQRKDMPLGENRFTAWRLNWSPKSQNLKALAKELKLGLDSFIFLDDNPVECAEVEANCPEVLVLQLPEDPELIPSFLEHCWVFDRLKLTEEDRTRAKTYRQNQQREQLLAGSSSLADFLAGLELNIRLEPMSPDQLVRVAQLTQRTNQFNFTTHRRTESEIQQLLQPPAGQTGSGFEVLTVSVSDRFGDYGLTGVMIFTARGSALSVDTFLLSCRVLGRGVEHRMLSHLGEIAQKRKLSWVDLHFHPSPKNKPAHDFLESVGAPFRQPLNGGYLFRFPAGFAAEVVLNGQSGNGDSAVELNAPQPRPAELQAQASRRKFSRCREIALQANDPARIHQEIEAKSAVRRSNRAGYAAPRTELETTLCEAWQKLLRIERVGVHDNFFELGGHSLLAVRLFADIERITGRKLPLVTIFQSPTIRQLAGELEGKGPAAQRSLLVPVQPNGSRPPLFLVHGAGGDVLWGYANLAAHLPDQPIYGIRSRGQTGYEELNSIEKMAAIYLEAVRSFQPRGPYLLGGYCFGGNVAYEMARRLEAQGEQVALLALFDSAPANAGYEKLAWWRPGFAVRFAKNLYYWLQDFALLDAKERRNFFARKARTLSRKVVSRFSRHRDASQVDIEAVIDPRNFPENELRLWRLHLQAITDHIEREYGGRLVLLRTRGQPIFCSLEDDFCWGKLAKGGVEVRQIPGSHENVFIEPNVRFLAKELEDSLSRALAAHARK
jgi:amino acid adenylation domain-containing protein/FkbH-like protein